MQLLDFGALDLMDVMGNDKRVVNAARISFANEDWIAPFAERDEPLLRYLIRNKHVSPFYHPQLTFRVKAPISIQRQWFKHKIGTAENSESTRYIEVHEEFYIPEKFRKQSKDNKQGSAEDFEEMKNLTLQYMRNAAYKTAYRQYCYELEAGVAKELARDNLPLATYTSWVWTASLQAVIHFLELRESHAQWEIGQYAAGMRQLIQPHFPIILGILAESS